MPTYTFRETRTFEYQIEADSYDEAYDRKMDVEPDSRVEGSGGNVSRKTLQTSLTDDPMDDLMIKDITITQKYEDGDFVRANLLGVEGETLEEVTTNAWNRFDRNHCRHYAGGEDVLPTSAQVVSDDGEIEYTV